MSITAAALRELHRIHQQLADLRDRSSAGRSRFGPAKPTSPSSKPSWPKPASRPSKRKWRVDRKQLDLKSGEQKVVDLRVKLNACNSNREYQALLEQIAAAEMAGSVLSDEILEGLEKIDQLGGGVKEAEKNLAAGKQELEKARPGRRRFGRHDSRRSDAARSRAGRGREGASRRFQGRLPARCPQQGRRQPGRRRRRRLHRLRPADHAQHAERAEALEARVLQDPAAGCCICPASEQHARAAGDLTF